MKMATSRNVERWKAPANLTDFFLQVVQYYNPTGHNAQTSRVQILQSEWRCNENILCQADILTHSERRPQNIYS